MASRFGERFFVKPRFEKRRKTVCISNFSNRRIGGKDPSKREGAIVWCCLSIIASGDLLCKTARRFCEKMDEEREGAVFRLQKTEESGTIM